MEGVLTKTLGQATLCIGGTTSGLWFKRNWFATGISTFNKRNDTGTEILTNSSRSGGSIDSVRVRRQCQSETLKSM